jgi:hypothetical protein
LEFYPFRRRLLLDLDDTRLDNSKVAIKSFRNLFIAESISTLGRQIVTAANWKLFWQMSLTSIQRNTLFRLLHNKIPTRKLLFAMGLSVVPSSSCIFCADEEDVFHFFFRCPTKFVFWDALIREFLWPNTTIEQLHQGFLSLDFRSIHPLDGCPFSVQLLLITALSEMWRAHWRHVIDSELFSFVTLLYATRKRTQKTVAEDSLRSD